MKKKRRIQLFVQQTFTEHVLCSRHCAQASGTERAAQGHRWLKDCFKYERCDRFYTWFVGRGERKGARGQVRGIMDRGLCRE